MEHKKDSFYKTDKALSNKGQEYSSAITEDSVKKGDLPANVPEYNFNIFLNKKTEKLTIALYMVTSFLSDNEPLKWKLRERSVDLLSDITTVRNDSVSEVENIFADYSQQVEEIISLLEVAAASKLISEMNFSILKKEYISLNSFITSDEYADKRAGRFTFPKGFFLEDGLVSGDTQNSKLNMLPDSDKKINEADKEDNKGHYEEYRKRMGQIKPSNTTTTSSNISDISKRQKSYNTTGRPIKDKINRLQNTKESKINRRTIILKLFKKNKELTIKDVSCEVSGCSEKTIQRELLALVSTGVLNKKGERRWSRYSLK